jgi:hypothetical protein
MNGAAANMPAASTIITSIERVIVRSPSSIRHHRLERPQRQDDEHHVESRQETDPELRDRRFGRRLKQRRRPRTPAIMTGTVMGYNITGSTHRDCAP